MVLLCMTPAMVAAVQKHRELHPSTRANSSSTSESDQDISSPAEGNPISHFQLVNISQELLAHVEGSYTDGQEHGSDQYRLNFLLRGAKFYVSPPPPKAQPSPEFVSLMARLRAAEEQKSYERMLKGQPASDPRPQSFYERFPQANLFDTHPENHADDDETTYQDINRQLTLIINILVSIVACAAALWMAARHWSVPSRLALSMGGSILVAVAEVSVYGGYLNKVQEAKKEEKKAAKKETKEIVDTWVIEGKGRDSKPKIVGEVLGQDPRDSVRLRKKNTHSWKVTV